MASALVDCDHDYGVGFGVAGGCGAGLLRCLIVAILAKNDEVMR